MPCFYCGVRLRSGGIFQKTKDHVIPLSKGGTKTVDACLKCNQAKGNMSLEEFRWRRGGIEFWGEMRVRLEAEKVAWIYEFDPSKSTVPTKLVTPSLGSRPIYEPSVDVSKIKQYKPIAKVKRVKKKSPQPLQGTMPDLSGRKYGALTVLYRITGAWIVKCICGAQEHRSSKAILNPNNGFDSCVECRRPVGKLKSAIFKETGVEPEYGDCFQQIHGVFLGKAKEDVCPGNGELAGTADADSSSINEIIQDNERSIM